MTLSPKNDESSVPCHGLASSASSAVLLPFEKKIEKKYATLALLLIRWMKIARRTLPSRCAALSVTDILPLRHPRGASKRTTRRDGVERKVCGSTLGPPQRVSTSSLTSMSLVS